MRAFILFLCCALIIADTSIVASAQAADKNLKVGAILSLTGDAANNGNAMRKGLEMAAAELQALGWKVELNFQDGATMPTRVVSALQSLLSRGYGFFVGPTWSFEINAVRTLLERSEALTIAPAGSSDINGGPSPAIFNLFPSRSALLGSILHWLSERHFKKAAVLTPLGDWGLVHRDIFLKALKERGIEVVLEEQFDYGIDAAGARVLMLRAKQKGADCFMVTAAASDLAVLARIKAELAWQATMLTTEDLWDVFDSGLLLEDSPAVRDAWVAAIPLNADFVAKYQKHFHEAPALYADRGYDALMLLARAAEKTDGSVAAVRKYLATQSDYEGVTGSVRFNQLGDRESGDVRVMPAFNNRGRH